MEMKINKSNWTKVKLIDLVTKKEENDKENAANRFDKFLKVEHLDAESLHIKRWASQKNGDELNPTFYKVFRKGQILFPTRNPHLRRSALASFDGICGEKTLTLEPNEELLISEFIPFLFHSESFYAHTAAAIVGSTNPHVRWRDVANYEFLLPPKDQQAKLAELLWAMDEVIESDVSVLEKLKTAYQVKIEESVPREFEEYWMFGDVIKTRKGITYKSSDYSDEENGTPLLNLKSIERGGGFNTEGIKYYNGAFKEEHFAKNEDLIVACTDITREGRVVGYPLHPSVYQDKRMLFTMDLIAISIIEDMLLRNYLYYVLKAGWVHWFLFAYSPGTTVLHLDLSGMKKLKIPKYDISIQKEIVSKLRQFENSIFELESKISSSKALQKSLINQVF
ncbi:restriction endonuclease subunit S [Gaetbulibacter sp. M240]|uniref:restriction endonuclease subunit S n=1 Tax=Gaetbulibacter sp. M240 TaxID=3126511 RepID=UPI00374F85D8